MIKAKNELNKAVGSNKIIAAHLFLGDEYDESRKEFVLKIGYSDSDLELFMKNIDFSYDDGYGGQELFGLVWLENNKWLERGEYDGSEWWELKEYPKLSEKVGG